MSQPTARRAVAGLRKGFCPLEVLRGIDLTGSPQGLVFGSGPSGSGKSTLLRCCNRLEEPDQGSVRVDGVELLDPATDINAMRRRIGMVFQSFNLYPHMTVLANVTLALRKALGRSRAEAREIGEAALARVGLADKANARSEEHTSELQSLMRISYADFCLKKKKNKQQTIT